MANTLMIRNILVYGILVYFLLRYSRANNLWGVRKVSSKTTQVVKKEETNVNKRNRAIKFYSYMEKVGNKWGVEPTREDIMYYRFAIRRVGLNSKTLDRELKPLELMGMMKIVKFISAFLMVLGLFVYKKKIMIILGLGVFVEPILRSYVDREIYRQDKEIEEDFPELYQLLYSRLLKGTDTRLGPTLQDYLDSIDVLHGENSHKAIRAFVNELMINIELYGDDTMAIMKLRDVYKSAMLVNFFNLATQSLSGVENERKLSSFKDELQLQNEKNMERRAEDLGIKGQRAVYVIYVILLQFVIISWISKLGGMKGLDVF